MLLKYNKVSCTVLSTYLQHWYNITTPCKNVNTTMLLVISKNLWAERVKALMNTNFFQNWPGSPPLMWRWQSLILSPWLWHNVSQVMNGFEGTRVLLLHILSPSQGALAEHLSPCVHGPAHPTHSILCTIYNVFFSCSWL